MIELQNISKSFGTGEQLRVVLKDVSWTINAGDFMTISAPSGSGKSTILHIIGCLDKPDSGNLIIDGVEINKMNDKALALFRNEKIGFIFQSFHLIPVLTALENVAYPLVLKGIKPQERREKSCAMLEMVGLGDHLRKRPKHLSGGQKQRVAIARALICDPKIILADEPSANLDSETAREIIELMSRLNSEQGATFLISTHDPNIAKYATQKMTIHEHNVIEVQDA